MENSRAPSNKDDGALKLQSSKVESQRRRRPLVETTKWINNHASLPHSLSGSAPVSSPPGSAALPHHTSLAPGGVLPLRKNPSLSPPHAKAEDKRVSAISSEGARDSNRNSQISTVSTNASGTGRTKKAVGPWLLGPTIGKGATGRVRKAKHRFTGQLAAAKIVGRKSADIMRSQSLAIMETMGQVYGQDSKKSVPLGIERESVIMKLIEHPNVIRLFDMWENRGEL